VRTQTLFEIVTHSPEETVACGRKLAGALGPPCLVLLEGELGSGKTTLVKGIVAGLGAAREEEVNSPTFTLVHEYGTPGHEPGQAARETRPGPARKVYHVDLYRIEEPGELSTLGLEDLMADNATVVVEWGEKFRNLGRASRVRIRLEHLGSDDRRIVVERLEA
jgi:tRNA threonylcarbamoyladenosine biosynthesis protein TsaE